MTHLLEQNLTAHIGTQKYLCTINWRNGQMIMDEPVSIGGGDLGPDPYSTLLASLAGCTLSTLRMYIDRKGWNVPELSVSLNMYQETSTEMITTIERIITFPEGLDTDIKERLLVIAGKCPVSKILENKIVIHSKINE
ncbi:MAG: OsmC family protein [Bacteroidetes bacterium]|nr:OsmC family protein [Bacteroidota bacterium]